MALVGLNNILGNARAGKYAIPAFDVSNYDMARAVLDVAEELNSPAILMGLKGDLSDEKFEIMADVMIRMAKNSKVDVCVHLDHSPTFELVQWAIKLGYSSVMIDASQKPLAENIAMTKKVTDYAHAHNVSVEAELGHVGDGIVGDGSGKSHEGALTRVDDMKKFISETNVDCLAVAIGTQHGVYKGTPKLHLDLMEELNTASTVPLVMHGGSGTPDEDVVKSIHLGMSKINIFSDILKGYYTGMKDYLNKTDNLSVWTHVANQEAIDSMKEVIRYKYKTFGAVNVN